MKKITFNEYCKQPAYTGTIGINAGLSRLEYFTAIGMPDALKTTENYSIAADHAITSALALLRRLYLEQYGPAPIT